MMANSELLESYKARWGALSSQDRIALILLGIFLGALLLVYGAMIPAHRFADEAVRYFQKQADLYRWVEANAERAKGVVEISAPPETAASGESLLSIASGLAKTHQISFKRFEPNGDSELRVWLEKTSFNALLAWLGELNERHSIKVVQANIDKRELAGTVNARIVLNR